jgi:hypothetical protein
MSMDIIAFVRQHGVVLESGKGPVPNLAEAVAGTPIRGSWWNHPAGKQIFRATRLVRDSEQILVCRLVEGKITYVHRRMWPALVRLAGRFDKKALAAIREEHSASGAHRVATLPFSKWVPVSARNRAEFLSDAQAASQLGPWATALVRRHSKLSSKEARRPR